MNSTPGWAPQPLMEVLKDSVFCSNSCGMLWSKWDMCTHCEYSGRGCNSLYEYKCVPGHLVKNRLWGWKIWWQIKCTGIVLLVDGLCIPAVPLRLEDWEVIWKQVVLKLLGNISSLLFISKVTCESLEGFILLKSFCLSKNTRISLSTYVPVQVSG